MLKSATCIFNDSLSIMKVNENITCSEWADRYFFLSPESSNTSGPWKTTHVQKPILNAMGNDAIEKVDFFKSARFGGTKMLVIAGAYGIAHKNRNTGFYMPTKGDSDTFVKREIEPTIRDCGPIHDKLISHSDKSPNNTLSFKAFKGSNAYFKGGHSPNSFRALTLDTVLLDELDGFKNDVGGEGDPTTLSWGRIKNSVFKKQIQISTPLIEGFSMIEKSSKAAEDIMRFQVKCPNCGEHDRIYWGGPDVAYGLKWQDRDPHSVLHYCKKCGSGWGNNKLISACSEGFYLGDNGLKTYDGINWFKDVSPHEEGVIKDYSDLSAADFQPCPPPRHIAFKAWSAYSPFSPWSQIVEEWYDAQGDIKKLQAFTNTTRGKTWALQHAGTLTKELVDGIIPTANIDDIIALTAGIDTQDDRLEIHIMGHTRNNDLITIDYIILHVNHVEGWDMRDPDIYIAMSKEVYDFRLDIGKRKLGVIAAAIDTQGHHTDMVHKFLTAKPTKSRKIFFGINGTANGTFEIADKAGSYKGVSGSSFYSIGVNLLKQKIYTAIRNHDKPKGAYKIWEGADLPHDFSEQMTAEKMDVKTLNGVNRVVFTNKSKKRNEALDTTVYNLAAKAYIKKHRGRRGKALFAE